MPSKIKVSFVIYFIILSMAIAGILIKMLHGYFLFHNGIHTNGLIISKFKNDEGTGYNHIINYNDSLNNDYYYEIAGEENKILGDSIRIAYSIDDPKRATTITDVKEEILTGTIVIIVLLLSIIIWYHIIFKKDIIPKEGDGVPPG